MSTTLIGTAPTSPEFAESYAFNVFYWEEIGNLIIKLCPQIEDIELIPYNSIIVKGEPMVREWTKEDASIMREALLKWAVENPAHPLALNERTLLLVRFLGECGGFYVT